MMTSTSRLYDAMNDFLRQCDLQWRDIRHLKTLCWMMVGMIESQNVHLNGFGIYINSRAQFAQSHQRRFRRYLSNPRIDLSTTYQALMAQALSGFALPLLASGQFRLIPVYRVCLTLNLPLPPSANRKTLLSVNLLSSAAFQLPSFVSQAGE